MKRMVTLARGPAHGAHWRLDSENRTFLLFLAPAVIFLAAVVIYPLTTTLWGSLFAESLVRPEAGRQFVGAGNYAEVLKDPSFWATLGRTVVWTVGSVLGKTLTGLILALLLASPFRGNGLYRVFLLVPWATPQVVGAVVWKWLYNSQNGYLSHLLNQVGLADGPVAFLGLPSTALVAAMLVDMWFGIPFMAIVLLAGLQSIPKELYEAVEVDGANWWGRFRHITLPLLVPVLGVATNLSVIWTFNSFNIIQTMTGGGPVGATEILVIRAYKEAFGRYDVGMASTYAAIIFLILMAFSLLYWRFLRKGGEV